MQRTLAALEGTEAALLLSSGMGATACAMLALLRPGDHLLANEWIYGGTRRLFLEEFAAMGIEVTLVDPTTSRGWRSKLRGGGPSAERFLSRLTLIKHAPSLGGVDSLISEPRFSSHARLTADERAAAGIPDGFLRISVGIEDVADFIADVQRALG